MRGCLVACLSLIACTGVSPDETESRASAVSASSCPIPAYEVPVFTPAADDAVVFDALLAASGYGASSKTWNDVAVGNFCGGAENEIVLVANDDSSTDVDDFRVFRGPSPYLVGSGDLTSASSYTHPWRGIAAADVDGDGRAEILAIRRVATSGVPDLVIGKVSADCDVSVTPYATKTIGTPSNADWRDLAVGNFDGTPKLAMIRSGSPNTFVVEWSGTTLTTRYAANLPDSNAATPWRAIAAGNIDGGSRDELIAVRTISDGVDETVRAYNWGTNGFGSSNKWSTWGNTGNNDWVAAAAGNFGGGFRDAVVLLKNDASRFTVLDFNGGSSGGPLRVLRTSELDTAGLAWRGVAAADWLGGDGGYEELVAIRDTAGVDEMEMFVYGNAFHRALRANAIADTKAVIAGNENADAPHVDNVTPQDWSFYDIEQRIKLQLAETHSNTYNVELRLGDEYKFLVDFLEATKDFCVDGRQLRVWVTIVGWSFDDVNMYSVPYPYAMAPPYGECEYFAGCPLLPYADECSCDCRAGQCTDPVGWASLLSALAQQYPHLVAVGFDDFFQPGNWGGSKMTVDRLAEMQSRLSWPSGWLSLVPTVYYDNLYPWSLSVPADVPLALDSMLFYYENKPSRDCTSNTAAPAQITEVANHLASGRTLQQGVYFSPSSVCATPPTTASSHDLLMSGLANPRVDGTTVYTGTKIWRDAHGPCATPTESAYCAVQDAYAP
jgi:hypothetical protein